MKRYEQEVLKHNKGKKVKFLSGLGGIMEGYIQNADYHFGCFNYEVSKAKNPRSEFNLNTGNWFLVGPSHIIGLE